MSRICENLLDHGSGVRQAVAYRSVKAEEARRYERVTSKGRSIAHENLCDRIHHRMGGSACLRLDRIGGPARRGIANALDHNCAGRIGRRGWSLGLAQDSTRLLTGEIAVFPHKGRS